jgi:hypothetical protein
MKLLPIKCALVAGELVIFSCTLFERTEPDNEGTDKLSSFGFTNETDEGDEFPSEQSKDSKWGTFLRRTSRPSRA